MKYITRRITITMETEKAYLLSFRNGKALWFPKSTIELYGKRENNLTGLISYAVDFPEWIIKGKL